MDCSTPGLPVHHHLPELAQTHVHQVGDAIQPSHPMSSPSPPAFNLFQHQGLFQWVGSLHEVARVLEFQLYHQSFQWIFRTDFLWDGLVGSPCSPRDSQVFSSITAGVGPQLEVLNLVSEHLQMPLRIQKGGSSGALPAIRSGIWSKTLDLPWGISALVFSSALWCCPQFPSSLMQEWMNDRKACKESWIQVQTSF